MRVLVTGASGFVGSAVLRRLANEGRDVRGAYRQSMPTSLVGAKCVFVGDLVREPNWQEALNGVAVVVHTAARVHVMSERSSDPLAEFRRVNVDGTANLARQSAAAGVKRFIFLSSIKVNGEFTKEGQAFTADDAPAPEGPYGISKYEAEKTLRQIAADTGMDVVIIRPPLVYGSGVKANFESMMRWLARDVPLPLASVTDNRRSLVALDNLVDLIVTCLNHPAAANQTVLVSDGEDLSTAELLKRMGEALDHPAQLFHIPPALMKLGAALFNKSPMYHRLCGSLQLDITKTTHLLGWSPPVSVDEGLQRSAQGFRP